MLFVETGLCFDRLDGLIGFAFDGAGIWLWSRFFDIGATIGAWPISSIGRKTIGTNDLVASVGAQIIVVQVFAQ